MNTAPAQRHALITGASRGIGAAIACSVAAEGLRVTLVGREEATLRGVIAQFPDPAAGFAVEADITQADAVTRAFERASAHFGPITILVNNAGAATSASLARTSNALWEQMLAVNVSGAFYCARAAAPGMLAARFGRIINIASTAGLQGFAYTSAYVAAKHALVGLTRALAQEFAGTGITVNAICPGFVETDILRDAVANIVATTGRTEAQARAELLRHNPIDRFLAPEEVARVLTELIASERTGEAVVPLGGEAFR